MNSNQHQPGNTVQISGCIQKFRKIPTKTARPMAAFAIGGSDAKCFDACVNEAESYDVSQKWVQVTGHFSHHAGYPELVAETIVPAASANTAAQLGAVSKAIAETSVQSHALKEKNMIMEN